MTMFRAGRADVKNLRSRRLTVMMKARMTVRMRMNFYVKRD